MAAAEIMASGDADRPTCGSSVATGAAGGSDSAALGALDMVSLVARSKVTLWRNAVNNPVAALLLFHTNS
jgi:hypothetical protein